MKTLWMDRLGSMASAVCTLHCLALALAPALISVLGLSFLANEAFEWGFFTIAVAFAGAAALIGYRVHRASWVVLGFGLGIVMLAFGRLGEALNLFEGSALFAMAGGLVLVATHLASLRQLRACSSAECA
ncbi:MAG: MerC domain-containing protein [Myxococcota bacterium]